MAQPFSTRDDLKKDPLQEFIKQSLEWIAVNRQTFFSVLGTVAVCAVVIAFVASNFRNMRSQAWEKYSMGQNWVYANNPDNAMNYFNEVISNYPNSPAAVYSLLAKGDLLHSQRKFTESIETYKLCLAKNPKKIIVPFVLSGLGSAQEESGDYASAISTCKQFVADYPSHFLAPKTYESLARTYELSLNPDAAREVYEKIITIYPATYWAEKARARYQALSPQPFQTNPAQGTQVPIPAPQGK